MSADRDPAVSAWAAALAAYNAAVALARAAYWSQTHCHVCGAFVHVDPSQRDGRLCSAACRAEAERARKRKGARTPSSPA